MFKIPPKIRMMRKIGRNTPCPCGSNIKFKNCCAGHIDISKLVTDVKIAEKYCGMEFDGKELKYKI